MLPGVRKDRASLSTSEPRLVKSRQCLGGTNIGDKCVIVLFFGGKYELKNFMEMA